MTEKKSTDKSVTNKKTYFKKERKFSDADLKRFKKLEKRFLEILENEKKLKGGKD